MRHLAAHRTHAQRRLLLEQRHRHAVFPRRGGNLKANPAATDNGQFLTFRQTTFQTLRILPVAQGIDLRMHRPRLARQTRPPSGGDQKNVVTKILAVAQTHRFRLAVDLLRAAATDARRRARTDGRLRAARLGARLLLPMGLCTLPAFLLLGVGPMLLSVMAGSTPLLAAP